jgi:hypothetical protein
LAWRGGTAQRYRAELYQGTENRVDSAVDRFMFTR